VRDDLQELVDRVSAVLGAPATLEAADFTLLAFCAHPMGGGPDGGSAAVLDAVRTRSILTRGSPAETRRWFEEFGIATADGPLRTPDDPAAGIKTRLVLPVRHAGATLGYLWLLDGGRTDPTDVADPALAEAVALAEEAGRRLARPDDRDGDLPELLGAALTGTPAARAAAERGLSAALGAAPQVLVVLSPAGELPQDFGVAAPGAVTARLPGLPRAPVAVLLPLPGGADLRPAAAVSSAALTGLPAGSTAGLSEVREGTAGLREQWQHAQVAAAVAAVARHLSPVASWEELGGWRLVSELAGPDPAVVPLLAEPLLAATAETWLDLGGSPGRTAAALCVHRQTLYYRLGRIEALTGLHLDDGDARLLLHASLRRARLPF
jgi:PucR C-terminal helix-turn-helix domain